MFFNFNEFNSKDYKLAIESIPSIAFFNEEEEQVINIVFAKENKENDLLLFRKNFKGTGELILSTMPDVYFKVIRAAVIEERKNKIYTVYSVNFTVEGNIYLWSGKDEIELGNKEILYNDYLESEPILKIYCNGNGDIRINGEDIHLVNINNYVFINSELEECYDDFGFKNNNVELEVFPKLLEGENTISFDGDITKITIIPNWRC